MVGFGFLFWLFFIGIFVASLQDLKRREVDDWLNLFLLFSGIAFIVYEAISLRDSSVVLQLGFFLFLMFLVMNAFYYGRVFAGGDAKLLFAMTPLFIAGAFLSTLSNLGIFLLFLMFSGAVYGLVYSFVLYFLNFKKVNQCIKKEFNYVWLRYVFLLGVVFFVLSYFNFFFLFLAIISFILPLLYSFSKSLEGVIMIKNISGKKLREGDWLAEDIKVGKKLLKANWEGLSLKDIEILKKKKSVKIKEGLPFVPAFFIAFLAYIFLKEWFVSFIFGLV